MARKPEGRTLAAAPDWTALAADLAAAVDALGLALDVATQARLLDYLRLLLKWGRVYNLTAVLDPPQMLRLHLLDSLAALPAVDRWVLRRQQAPLPLRVLDVGSGAGLPGVVWAVCRPGWRVCCVDTVAKKVAFITQAALSLGLTGQLRARHSPVQALGPDHDLVVSRAFAALSDFVTWSANARAAGGVWLALKGKPSEQELAGLPAGVAVFHVEPIQVPGLDAERCLVWIQPSAGAGSSPGIPPGSVNSRP